MKVSPVLMALSMLLCGCEAALTEAYRFPSTWPGSTSLGEDAPTVSVYPIRFDTEQNISDVPQEGLPTDAVLSALMVKHLHVNGVQSILESEATATARYSLDCNIPHLGYSLKGGYPKERIYRAELSCLLKDSETENVLWNQSFKQVYEQQELLNMFTKIPDQPNRHERVLFRECIIPLWDVMAGNIGTVVTRYEAVLRAQVKFQED